MLFQKKILKRGFILLIKLTIVCSTALFAQKKIEGQVVLDNGEGIESKVYINNSQFFTTDKKGNFSYSFEDGITKIRDVGITKKGYKFVKWSYDANEHVIVIIQGKKHQLTGRLLNEFNEGYPYASVKIEGLKDSVITNKQGAFVFKWTGTYKVNAQTKFHVNGESVPRKKAKFFSHFSTVKILFIPKKINEINEINEIRKDSSENENEIQLADKKEKQDTLSKDLQTIIEDEKGIIPDENELVSGSEVDTLSLATKDSVYTPKENFDYIFNKLDYEKQFLTENSVQIVSAMDRITARLQEDGDLRAEEKLDLSEQLDLLEKAFIDNRLAYEGVQNKTKKVLDKMKKTYVEKDSLYALAIQAQMAKKDSQGRVDKLNRFLILGAFILFGLTGITFIFYFLYKKREKEKVFLKEALKEKEEQRNQLNIQAKELEQLNSRITETNLHLENDLHYALAFQKATLPSSKDFASVFKDNFILYRPKNLVSGDFYWFTHIANTNKTLLALGDCIGHGIAGGFMSMIGVTLLNEAIENKKIHQPKEILSWLNTAFRKILPSNQEKGRVSIDMIVCLIERNDKGAEVIFSGANISFYYLDSHEGKLHRIKGDVKSVAGRQGMRREFTQTKVNLKSGDAIYLSSDGYTDQNNAKGERLGRKRFEALVEENHLLPMKGQQQLLEKNLAIFQKGASQRDDIAIFGLKIP